MSAFANTTGRSEWGVNAGKAYLSTGPFNNAFYTYAVTQNSSFQTIGTLTLVSSSTTACPGGRQLVLNGRKLTPGANPMNFITGAATIGNNPFVYGSSFGQSLVALTATGTFNPRFMVGVADVVSGLSGFVDPTNVLFALFDKNRPVTDYIIDMTTGLSVASAITLTGSGQSDRVNTKSIVTGVNSSGTTANIGSSSTGQVRMQTGTTPQSIVVTSSVVTPNSIILLTPANVNAAVVAVTAASTAASTTLTVSATAGSILTGMALPASFGASASILYITGQLTGTTGGVGTYSLNVAATSTVAAASVNLLADTSASLFTANVSVVGTNVFTITAVGTLATSTTPVVNFLIVN